MKICKIKSSTSIRDVVLLLDKAHKMKETMNAGLEIEQQERIAAPLL